MLSQNWHGSHSVHLIKIKTPLYIILYVWYYNRTYVYVDRIFKIKCARQSVPYTQRSQLYIVKCVTNSMSVWGPTMRPVRVWFIAQYDVCALLISNMWCVCAPADGLDNSPGSSSINRTAEKRQIGWRGQPIDNTLHYK